MDKSVSFFDYIKVFGKSSYKPDKKTLVFWGIQCAMFSLVSQGFRPDSLYKGQTFSFGLNIIAVAIVIIIINLYMSSFTRESILFLLPSSPHEKARRLFQSMIFYISILLIIIWIILFSVTTFLPYTIRQNEILGKLVSWNSVLWGEKYLLGAIAIIPVYIKRRSMKQQVIMFFGNQLLLVVALTGINTWLTGGKLTMYYQYIKENDVAVSTPVVVAILLIVAAIIVAALIKEYHIFARAVIQEYQGED